MPTDHEIKIISGDTATESLHLFPCDTVYVNQGDTVTWSITPEPTNVSSFRIKKKLHSGEIFSSAAPPPSSHTNRGRGRISNGAPSGRLYEYSIFWKSKGMKGEFEHDPKIAINTHLHDDKSNLLITAAIALTAIGLTALLYLSLQKRKKTMANNAIDAGATSDFTEPGMQGNEFN